MIRRGQLGDASPFERRLHFPRVYVLCLRVLGNWTEAENLTQEALGSDCNHLPRHYLTFRVEARSMRKPFFRTKQLVLRRVMTPAAEWRLVLDLPKRAAALRPGG